MGNNRSRIAPARTLRIIDSQTRARYQNQRELIQLRRRLANINMKHVDAMSRIAVNRHDVKMDLHEQKHETSQKELAKKLEKIKQENNVFSVNESDLYDESEESTVFECPSLLVHNLNASDEWGKKVILPNKNKSFPSNRSKFDSSYNSFEQTESFLLNDNLSLKQHTERMKKAVKIAVVKSTRDSNMIARRNGHKN